MQSYARVCAFPMENTIKHKRKLKDIKNLCTLRPKHPPTTITLTLQTPVAVIWKSQTTPPCSNVLCRHRVPFPLKPLATAWDPRERTPCPDLPAPHHPWRPKRQRWTSQKSRSAKRRKENVASNFTSSYQDASPIPLTLSNPRT